MGVLQEIRLHHRKRDEEDARLRFLDAALVLAALAIWAICSGTMANAVISAWS